MSTLYQVKVPLVLAHNKLGHVEYFYEGAIIPWLDKQEAKRFLDEKLVVEVASADQSVVAEEDGAPPKSALKEEWVKWAVKCSASTEEPLTAEAANELSKDDLIDLYG